MQAFRLTPLPWNKTTTVKGNGKQAEKTEQKRNRMITKNCLLFFEEQLRNQNKLFPIKVDVSVSIVYNDRLSFLGELLFKSSAHTVPCSSQL